MENCSHEQTRMDRARRAEKMNRDESLLEIGLSSTIAALLMQCSAYIFDSALSKIQNLVGERTFEPNVAGRFVARMCGCVTKVNSEKALKVFLPPVLGFLRSALTEDVLNDEILDDSILFKLLMLSELVILYSTLLAINLLINFVSGTLPRSKYRTLRREAMPSIIPGPEFTLQGRLFDCRLDFEQPTEKFNDSLSQRVLQGSRERYRLQGLAAH